MASKPSLRFKRGGNPALALLNLLMISVLAGVLVAGMALPFLGTAGLAAKSASDHFEDIPDDLKTPDLPQRSTIRDANGGIFPPGGGHIADTGLGPFHKIQP